MKKLTGAMLLLRLFLWLNTIVIGLAALSPITYAQSGKENSEFKLAVNLYNDGMYDLAVEQLKNFVSNYPATAQGVEARYYLGLTQVKLKKYEEARVTFQNFALSYVEHNKAPEAWLNVGEAFLALGNEREAASAYERVKVFHPKSALAPEALLKAAELYRKTGERDNAKKALRTIIQEYPTAKNVLQSRLLLGEIYSEEGQTELAEREARRVSESDAPASVKAAALFSIGKMQASVSLFDEAEKTFRSVHTSYKGTPTASLALYELGKLETLSGKYQSALEHLDIAATDKSLDDSLRMMVYIAIGNLYSVQRDDKTALWNYEKAVSDFPKNHRTAEALLLAAGAGSKTGKWKDVLRYTKMGIESSPSPVKRRLLYLAGRAATETKQYIDAAQYYNTFLTQYPNDAYADEILFQLGSLYQHHRKDDRNAITAYDQMMQRYPQSRRIVEAAYNIGSCQQNLGDYEGAVKTYLDIQERFPGYKTWFDLDSLIHSMRRQTVKNRDEAIKKLTRLIGEVLSEKSKADLSFQLGEIYLHELQDFSSAAAQFTTAIESGITGDHLAQAYYLRARANHLQSASDKSLRKKAIEYYDAFLAQFPAHDRNEQATYYRFMLQTELTPDGFFDEANKFLTQHPKSAYSQEILLNIGKRTVINEKPNDAIPFFITAAKDHSNPSLQIESFYNAGKTFKELAMSDSAIVMFKKALDVPSVSNYTVDALADIIDLLFKNNSFTAALPYCERLSEEFFYTDHRLQSKFHLGTCYLRTGNYDNAITAYESILQETDSSVFYQVPNDLTFLSLSSAYEKKGNRLEAKQLLHRFFSTFPSNALTSQAFYSLGSLSKAEGNVDRASAYFKHAAMHGGAGSAFADIAEILFQTEQYAEAATQYLKLAQQSDSLVAKQSYQAKAIVATLRMDKLTEAQTMVTDFQKNFGKEKRFLAEFEFEKGNSFFRKQDYVSAKKSFEKVADDYEETRFGPWGEYYLGKILEVNNKLDDAAKQYEKILTKHPKSDVLPRVSLSFGNMHFNAERFEDAIRHYQNITSQPGNAGDVLPYAMNNLIEAYESTKLYDNALQMTRDFIERFPNDESIIDKKIKIGVLYTKIGYYDQAILHFQSILDEAGSLLEAELRYNIGEAYHYKGDYQQAILEFLKVPYLVSKQGKVDWIATSLYMAGQSYEKMSRFDEAIGMYQQIIDRTGIDPTFKSAARKEIDRVKLVTKKGSR